MGVFYPGQSRGTRLVANKNKVGHEPRGHPFGPCPSNLMNPRSLYSYTESNFMSFTTN